MNFDLAALVAGGSALVASSAQLVTSLKKKDGRDEAIAAIEARVAKFDAEIRAIVDAFAKRLDGLSPAVILDKSEMRGQGALAADVRRSIADVEALEARLDALGGLAGRVDALEAQRATDAERWNQLHRSLGRIEGKVGQIDKD